MHGGGIQGRFCERYWDGSRIWNPVFVLVHSSLDWGSSRSEWRNKWRAGIVHNLRRYHWQHVSFPAKLSTHDAYKVTNLEFSTRVWSFEEQCPKPLHMK